MAYTSPFERTFATGSGLPSFFSPPQKNFRKMSNTNEMKVPNLQMVEIDHSKFAVELLNGNTSVNLTQMSKPFGRNKRPEVWLRTQESRDYVNAMSVALKSATADLLTVKQRGVNQGTWVHDYRIAMRFAQWLSPSFSIAVDDLLVKLMNGNKVLSDPLNDIEPTNQLSEKSGDTADGVIYVTAMGAVTNHVYTLKGEVWAKLAPIVKLYGYVSVMSPSLRSNIGSENIKKNVIGKQESYFINLKGFMNFDKYSRNVISSKQLNGILQMYGANEQLPEANVFAYTYEEMLDILAELTKSPVNKNKVQVMLHNGRKK